MDVNVSIKMNKKFIDEPQNKENKTVASGWVEIDEMIKFPVNVRRYTDNVTKQEKMFVSYPQRKKADGTYEDIIRPANKETRALVEETVLKAARHDLTSAFRLPEISNVRVSMLKEARQVGAITIKAMASLAVNGFYITGLTVKEGKNGPFVQMPQHPENGEYKDTVYGVNSSVQQAIKDSVLYEYNKKINEPVQKQTENVENSSKPISSINISGLDYKEKGYLNFIIKTEGEELKSKFRIYDALFPENEQLKLLSVENADNHSNIAVLWDTIEQSLQEKMAEKYQEYRHERDVKMVEDNPFDNPELMKSPK